MYAPAPGVKAKPILAERPLRRTFALDPSARCAWGLGGITPAQKLKLQTAA